MLSIFESDGVVAARLTSTGVIANHRSVHGRPNAHRDIAQFIRVRDGLIEEIETYDCYEPFASK